MKGDFNLFGKADELYQSISGLADGKVANEGYYAEKVRYTENFKKAVLLVIHAASKKFDKKMVEEQEVLNNLTNMIIAAYAGESLALRVQKMESLKGAGSISIYKDILDVYLYDAAEKVRKEGLDAVYSIAADGEEGSLVKAIETLSNVSGLNVKAARRRIADKLIEDNAYKF